MLEISIRISLDLEEVDFTAIDGVKVSSGRRRFVGFPHLPISLHHLQEDKSLPFHRIDLKTAGAIENSFPTHANHFDRITRSPLWGSTANNAPIMAGSVTRIWLLIVSNAMS